VTKWLVCAVRVLRWALATAGAVAPLLTAMIAAPLARPPELSSMAQTAQRRSQQHAAAGALRRLPTN
jgi:hypothetical protein